MEFCFEVDDDRRRVRVVVGSGVEADSVEVTTDVQGLRNLLHVVRTVIDRMEAPTNVYTADVRSVP